MVMVIVKVKVIVIVIVKVIAIAIAIVIVIVIVFFNCVVGDVCEHPEDMRPPPFFVICESTLRTCVPHLFFVIFESTLRTCDPHRLCTTVFVVSARIIEYE
jgi:hypothetical protein